MTNKKNEKIEIRIDANTKEQFINYAKFKEKSISKILREYIEECIKNGEND